MARSHHRKKHKAHLRQYQRSQDSNANKTGRGKVTVTFAVIGLILGIAVGYFGSGGEMTWIAGIGVAGSVAGWLTGRYFDRETSR